MANVRRGLGDWRSHQTHVYELSRWINTNHAMLGFAVPPIPEPSITKPPSAELRPDQRDEDTLLPYEQLDQIIVGLIEREHRPSTSRRRQASNWMSCSGLPA